MRRVVLSAGELWLVLVVELPGDGHLKTLPVEAEIGKVVRNLGSVCLDVLAEFREIGCQPVGSGHNKGDSNATVVFEMLGDYFQISEHPVARLRLR